MGENQLFVQKFFDDDSLDVYAFECPSTQAKWFCNIFTIIKRKSGFIKHITFLLFEANEERKMERKKRNDENEKKNT